MGGGRWLDKDADGALQQVGWPTTNLLTSLSYPLNPHHHLLHHLLQNSLGGGGVLKIKIMISDLKMLHF